MLEKMDMILTWTDGDKKVFTKNIDLAEIAIKTGHTVYLLKKRPNVFRNNF